MTTSGERWDQVRELFDAARALHPEQRSKFLDDARPDAALRHEVEALLRAHAALEGGSAEGFLERLDADRAAGLLASGNAATLDPDELAPGTELGRYRVVRRLGHGGMGVVYLAHDTRLDRPAALKLLRRHLSLDAEARQRFEEEARAASALDHPNIVTVYDIGDAPDGRLFIAMAYHDGETLRQALAHGPLPVARVVALARQIAAGLAAAHRRGIVHRDVKPANILVTADGVAKLADFGIAKFAGSAEAGNSATPGTVAYMSPEQTRGEEVDARTDIWSLGVVLYEMLAGRRPFPGETRDAVIAAIRHDEPTSLTRYRTDVPSMGDRIIRRCLAKARDARYATADALCRELAEVSDRLSARTRTRRRVMPAFAAALAVTGAFLTRSAWLPGAVEARASVMAVLPIAPVGQDSALDRLGRELAITLSANLNGMGEIRTVPALTVLSQAGAQNLQPAQAARLARRLGARSVLLGTAFRNGGQIQLDLGLFAADGAEMIARASVVASADDINALTNKATFEILSRIWSRGDPPVPNLAAVTTESVPALRAYLEGELAFLRADFDDAVDAFRRAFGADSNFAFAYWRSLYPSRFEGSQPDSAVVARIIAHRDRFAEPERLLMDAYAAPTLTERLRVLQQATTQHPDYWPGWYDYANTLTHYGAYLGRTYADARAALDRVIALQPDFAPAWVHRIWIAALQRDVDAVIETTDNLERLSAPDGFWVNPDQMMYAYAVRELVQSGVLTGELATRLARVAVQPFPGVAPENLALRLFLYGFPRGSMEQVDAALQERIPPDVEAAQWKARAQLWAARGAWDSAFVAAERWIQRAPDPQALLIAYGLAVLGVTTGAVDAEAAARWRPTASPPGRADSTEWLAERAWLDGVVAHARRDVAAIAGARLAVTMSGARDADFLTNSLLAFERDAQGRRGEAARLLADLEWNAAEQSRHHAAAAFHPYVAAVHRPAAARWFLEAGGRRDTLEAARLLTWHEAILARIAGPVAANRVVEPLALYQRARIAEAWGEFETARAHYRGFVERYDRPPASHEPLAAGARAALLRLTSARR